MSEELFVRHCAPTLAGIKTGSLFSCSYKTEKQVVKDIRTFNRVLISKGLRIFPLKYSKNRVLVYVFRPEKLKMDLSNQAALNLLRDAGYRCKDSNQCVLELISRLKTAESFPHEIGLFLGYPPEDVRGFIENKTKNFKCKGYCVKRWGQSLQNKGKMCFLGRN